MNNQPTLFEGARLTMEDSIRLTRESLISYGSTHKHWCIASRSKDGGIKVIVPNASQIEAGREFLNRESNRWCDGWLADELDGLRKAVRKRKGHLSSDFAAGYLLGLEAARVVIRSSVAIAKAGVNPEDVL